ncbi:MAG: JAB domain-containing protein [Ginsengibacter sp.]
MESKMIPSAHYQVSEIDLVYKTKIKASERPQITTSSDAYEILKQSWDENKIEFVEQFKILFLNRANKVLALYEVSTGGITGTVVDIRLIFAAALKMNATSIVLAHNHPSSNTKPSDADLQLTLKIKEAGKFLDIKVLDHIIVTVENYFSFADEGEI